MFYFFVGWGEGGGPWSFFAVLRCFLFNVLLCACGGGAGGGGRDSQPSPTPGEGPITHEYIVMPTNYIYALCKETER